MGLEGFLAGVEGQEEEDDEDDTEDGEDEHAHHHIHGGVREGFVVRGLGKLVYHVHVVAHRPPKAFTVLLQKQNKTKQKSIQIEPVDTLQTGEFLYSLV